MQSLIVSGDSVIRPESCSFLEEVGNTVWREVSG